MQSEPIEAAIQRKHLNETRTLMAMLARQSNPITGAAIPVHPMQPIAQPPPSVI